MEFRNKRLSRLKLTKSIRETERPFLIAGPCSAETEEQINTVVSQLVENTPTKLLRAGIWKPRTRPDSFEGVGTEALPWFVEAAKTVGLPTSVEIANRHHTEEALKAGIDVLWIGARTTVNPFAVQEIADVLKGVNIPVMIKNPVNPDLELWIGAFERLDKSGIEDLVAIHRGFSFYKHNKYRNVPSWEIPIALKERLPQIPMICDPSHISGRRDLLLEISQKAMDLNFDGLMVETHPDPDSAWSDAFQQITPLALKDLLQNLVLRSSLVHSTKEEHFVELREKIAILDDRLFDILSARMKISEELGSFKRENNITILQQEHWFKMINKRLELKNDYQLTEKFIRRIMDEIHQESIRHQIKVMNPKLNSEGAE
jgi:chorismate mutase